jgi:hypothetical protein
MPAIRQELEGPDASRLFSNERDRELQGGTRPLGLGVPAGRDHGEGTVSVLAGGIGLKGLGRANEHTVVGMLAPVAM